MLVFIIIQLTRFKISKLPTNAPWVDLWVRRRSALTLSAWHARRLLTRRPYVEILSLIWCLGHASARSSKEYCMPLWGLSLCAFCFLFQTYFQSQNLVCKKALRNFRYCAYYPSPSSVLTGQVKLFNVCGIIIFDINKYRTFFIVLASVHLLCLWFNWRFGAGNLLKLYCTIH